MSTTTRKKKLLHMQEKRGYKLYAWLAESWSKRIQNDHYLHAIAWGELVSENVDLIRGTAMLASAIEGAKLTGRPQEVILHVSDCHVEEAKRLEAILRAMGYYPHKRGYDFGRIKAYFRIRS